MEENRSSENPLLNFTSNHLNHDSSWLFRGSVFRVECVACLIETLEDKQVLAIRKRKVLTELLVLLSRDEKLVNVLSANLRISSHLCTILVNLLEDVNETVSQMAIEALVQLSCKLQSEVIIRELIENIERRILELNNLRKSCPFVNLAGKLVHFISLLGEQLVTQKSKIWECCISSLSFPEENVKTALIYLALGVCRNKNAREMLSNETKVEIFRNCCESLTSAKSKDLRSNSLALLQSFTSLEEVRSLGLLAEDKEGKDKRTCLGNALKKLVLITDESIQIGGIQCVSKFLILDSKENIISRSMLHCGLAEFLFEGLETNNDIVLASLFCSLTELCNSQEFFKGSYSIYGVDSVVSGISKAFRLQNSETIQQGLHVLFIMASKQPRGIPLFANGTIFEKCLCAIEESFNAMEYKVLQEAINVMGSLLRIDQLPSGFNLTRLSTSFSSVVSVLKRFATKTVEEFNGMNAATAQNLLHGLLSVISQAINFTNEYRNKPQSLEEALLTDSPTNAQSTAQDKWILDLENFLLRATDETCVAAVMMNYEAIKNPAVFEILFSILNTQLSATNKQKSEPFAKKLATASFIRVSMEINRRFCKGNSNKTLLKSLQQFQRNMFICLSDAPQEELQMFDSLTVTPSSPEECLTLLTQLSLDPISNCVSDKELFNVQCFCIEMLYLAYIYKDVIAPDQLLLKGLHRFICLHKNLLLFPDVTLRHLLSLYADLTVKYKPTLSSSDQKYLYESQKVLEKTLQKMKVEDFHNVSSFSSSFVIWIFGSCALGKAFGRSLLEKLIEKNQCPLVLWNVLIENEIAVKSLLSLVLSDNTRVVTGALKILEATMDGEVHPNHSETLVQITSEELRKLFLRNQASSLPDNAVETMLKILLLVQIGTGSEAEMKLLHFVIDILIKARTPRITIAAINYLNVTLKVNLDSPQPRAAVVLFANQDFMSWLQKTMTSLTSLDLSKCDAVVTNVYAACILLVTNLVLSKNSLHNTQHGHITTQKEVLIDLMNENHSSVLRLASLVFWKAFLASKNQLFLVFEENKTRVNCQDDLEDIDLNVMLVYIQNCLIHESEAIKSCSLSCLKSLFPHVNRREIRNPWNTVILETLIFPSMQGKLSPSLVQFCTLMLKTDGHNEEMDAFLSAAAKLILQQIPTVPLGLDGKNQLPPLTSHCISFLREFLLMDSLQLLSSNSEISAWLKKIQEISKPARNAKKFDCLKVNQVIFSEDSIYGQTDIDDTVLSEVILKLESKMSD